MRTWNLYLFKKIGSLTLLFLFGIFLLYSLFDMSTHLSDFYTKEGLRVVETLKYYSCCLLKEQEMFFSLSFLLATLFTALSLTTSKQIIALQAASISLRKAYLPMIVLGLGIAGILLGSQQFLAPPAVSWVKHYKMITSRYASTKLHVCHIGPTKLFFSSYNKEKKVLEDCIWIFDHHKILRCKELEITGKEPYIHYGHLIEWDDSLKQYVQQSILHSKLLSYEINEQTLNSRPKTAEEMSLSELFLISHEGSKVAKRAKSLFLYKISISFFPLILCMLWVPLCANYSRTFSSVRVILYSLFSLILFYAFWSVMQILGENDVFNPWLGFTVCFGILGISAMRQWKKII